MARSEKIAKPSSQASRMRKPESSTGKRKRTATSTPSKTKTPTTDPTEEADIEYPSPSKKKKKASPEKGTSEEKRLKRFRDHAPHSYLEKLYRATTQRMFVIDRSRTGTDGCPEESIAMVGSTGNVYSVHIGLIPSCTCPDNQKGNQCKHIVYVLHNVLKAPEHLQYQLAFLSSELREIFDAAPAPMISADTASDESCNRKPIEGDCPICFTPFDPSADEIVFCRAACGNNIHANCFEQWAKSQGGREVRCVYCRTPWQGDEEQIKRICRDKAKGGPRSVNGEGYVNVAQELGMSGARDYSTYHQHWVRRQGLGYTE
ncbi:MAG: hypothetical protein Q9217_005450 [Psora testacea]